MSKGTALMEMAGLVLLGVSLFLDPRFIWLSPLGLGLVCFAEGKKALDGEKKKRGLLLVAAGVLAFLALLVQLVLLA